MVLFYLTMKRKGDASEFPQKSLDGNLCNANDGDIFNVFVSILGYAALR
jgi:hypothetical protein